MENHLHRRLVSEKELGIEQFHQVPVFVNDSVLLPRLLCSLLGARCRGEVMNCLVLPIHQMIPDLYAVLGCCHGGNRKEGAGSEEEDVSLLVLKELLEGPM